MAGARSWHWRKAHRAIAPSRKHSRPGTRSDRCRRGEGIGGTLQAWSGMDSKMSAKKSSAGVKQKEASAQPFVASALRTLETGREGLAALKAAIADGLGDSFVAAVETIRQAHGRLIVTGMGKSGHIARKIAATL